MEADRIHAKLGDYFELIGGYAFKSGEFIESGIPVIKIKNVKANKMLFDDLSYVCADFLESRSEKIAKHGDLLITMSGNRFDGSPDTWVGKVAQFRELKPFLVNQRVGILRPKKGVEVDRRFFSFSLSSAFYQREFISIATSSGGQANLSPAQILGVTVEVPPLAEQKRIAEVLGALDDKIELNRRMNATLEATALALFQSWFIDFDPVRRNMDRNQPSTRPPGHPSPNGRRDGDEGSVEDIDRLFPDSFEESELGHIPKGWEVKPVGEVVNCVGGGTPSTSEPKYWEGGTHHWTTPKDFSSLQAPILLDTDRNLTDAGIGKISSGLLPAGTLLMSSRAPVGYLAISAIPIAINQGFIAMKCNEYASNYFMLNWCQQNMAEIEGRATGTTFAEISKQNFRPIPIILPSQGIMTAFSGRVAPLYDRITTNLRESRTLATLRDTLLPKLLSGEVSLKQAA